VECSTLQGGARLKDEERVAGSREVQTCLTADSLAEAARVQCRLPGCASCRSLAVRRSLQQATGAAVSTLLKVMVDPNTPASTKVRAADSVLDHSAKAIEIEDLEVRLTELERAAGTTKDRRSR